MTAQKGRFGHEVINNRESLRMEAQLKFVNTNKKDQKMENHFEDVGDEFD